MAKGNRKFHKKTFANLRWFRSRILRWFSENRRDFPWRAPDATVYEKIVSEILLQRTRAETVAAFFPSFVERFPSWTALADATIEDLEAYLRPIGLWRRRADSLKKLARRLVAIGGVFPANRQEVEELPNVGQYVGNAVMMFCHNSPAPLLDANMARVLERFFGPRKLADIRYDPYLQDLAKRAVFHSDPVTVNWALLDFAAGVCAIKPKCKQCPLSTRCTFFATRRLT